MLFFFSIYEIFTSIRRMGNIYFVGNDDITNCRYSAKYIQNLVSRIAGINNEELANRGIGMAGAMVHSIKVNCLSI